MKGYFRSGFLAFLFLLVNYQAFATHLRAGNITVTRPSCSSLTLLITITVYTNALSTVKFSDAGAGTLDFGDGTSLHPAQNDGMQVPGYGPAFFYVSVTYSHTYAGSGVYTISYQEDNRNAGILNMTNSVNTPFYIDTVVPIDAIGCDNSPQLTTPPIDLACQGVAWVHNAGAYDPDGDSLSYELVVPKQDYLDNVDGYLAPNVCGFYTSVGINCSIANQNKNGPPTFNINPETGTITWNAPGATGQYNIAFHIIEWRKIGGVYVQIGYVTRDMQIIVENCNDKPPTITSPADTCVLEGASISKNIIGTDPNGYPVELQAFSELLTINPSPAKVSPNPAVYQPTPATLTFKWTTVCDHVRQQPYQVVFKVTNSPPSNDLGGIPLVQFSTWNIKVVAPAPLWTSVTALPARQAQLSWQTYTCSNATTMQVWRRVNSYPYTPPNCVTGMPNLGYTLITTVPITTTQYKDHGLAPGAVYCYRLVAVFAQPAGGESYVSQESCITVLADAPIITNVTIDKTDPAAGEDTVKWIAPLNINVTQYPPPYTYSLLRSVGFSGNSGITPVFPGQTASTYFIDNSLNTLSTVYNYQVVAYSDSGKTLIDTSASASTVRLAVKPHISSIELNWSASVPWSNQTVAYPIHYIYRGPNGSSTLSDMVQIDTVNVDTYQFHYIDSGQYQHTSGAYGLSKSQTYCYCVRTQGAYGNPSIIAPLENYSQIICAQPNDTIPPCQPVVTATGLNCSQYLTTACPTDSTSFYNTLTWKLPTGCSATEAVSYNIYISSQTGGAFTLYTNVLSVNLRKDTSSYIYVDSLLTSYARCYKVSAVNSAGIESPLSTPFCFDNCPHYELPNVFTPNGDLCNELFQAYGAPPDLCEVSEEGESKNAGKCARFVNSVNFTIYNRWGKEVFTYQSGGTNNIYINWNGTDDNGNAVPAGVYYYLAEVNFNVVNPSQQNKNIKGWVQLIR